MDKLRVDCNTQAQMHSHTDGHRRWQWQYLKVNKANLRDLIAATGLVISNWIQIVNFSARVTVKFDGWPRKIIGHLFYATASFVHHFVLPIDEFKLELQSRNPQFGSNLTIFFSRVTYKFHGWPSKTIGHLFYATSSLVQHFVPIGEFKLELQSGNAQSGSNSMIFLAVWPWNLTDDLEKQQGTSSKQHQAVCTISSHDVNSNWIYGPETVKWGHDLCDLDFWPLTLTFCMDITSVIGNNSWKFHDDTMMGT